MKRYFEDKTEISTDEELRIALYEIGYMVDEAIHDGYSKKVCSLIDDYTFKQLPDCEWIEGPFTVENCTDKKGEES